MIIVDKIEDIIDNATIELDITSVSFDAVSKFVTCSTTNTQWIRPLKRLTIDGREGTIQSFIYNESFVILFDDELTISEGKYTIQNPFYRYGTVLEVDNELYQVRHTLDKYPLIYLHDRFTQSEDYSEDGNGNVTANLRFFFMDNYNENDWTKQDHYTNVIKPMHNLKNWFIKLLRDDPKIDNLSNADITSYVKFGTYTDNTGSINNLMSDYITAIEVRLDVQFINCC